MYFAALNSKFKNNWLKNKRLKTQESLEKNRKIIEEYTYSYFYVLNLKINYKIKRLKAQE